MDHSKLATGFQQRERGLKSETRFSIPDRFQIQNL